MYQFIVVIGLTDKQGSYVLLILNVFTSFLVTNEQVTQETRPSSFLPNETGPGVSGPRISTSSGNDI